jgi:hypothetical protein
MAASWRAPRKITAGASRRTFSSLLPKKQLLPGATFEIRITKAKTIGRVLALKIYKTKAATRTSLCLAPGAKRPSSCPR